MNKTLKEINSIIKSDKYFYLSSNIFKRIGYHIIKNDKYYIYKYFKYMRKTEHYKRNISFINKILYYYNLRKKNIYGRLLDLDIGGTNIGKNITIYHRNIMINPNSIIGDNCKFHGNNCVGNNAFTKSSPKIGNNVNIGVGASIIGDISVANNSVIGANALVNKNFPIEGSIIAGNPAKVIGNINNSDLTK